jgi:signal transduction histidine kinase
LDEPKERAVAAIARAQAELVAALAELERIPAFDAGAVAYIAHALSNYLTVSAGAVELALARLADHPDPEVRVWLEGTQHATKLMARLVGRLMNPAAPADRPFRIESFDLLTLARRACSFYQRVADRKAIRLAAGSDAGAPPVRADRVAAAAVLDNLLSNAIKYSPPGATVEVQVRGEGDWVVCAVRDSGPGLSPEDQARLFQRGVRLTPRPTAGEPSTGYGLAVAKELVESLGGRIECESEVGRGSCFSFRLPAEKSSVAETGDLPGGADEPG